MDTYRDYDRLRARMVRDQMRDVTDPAVLAAMGRVPRHLFVPPYLEARAYEDRPLEIGWGQTISQPYIVAYMIQAARLRPGDKVLEVGTGSGYQAAVLAEMGCRVFTVEIIPELFETAARNLERAGYRDRVRMKLGDGRKGWPEEAPFDAILVAAAPEEVPPALEDQLAPGGRLVVPVGGGPSQVLLLVEREDGEFRRTRLLPVRFVPLLGEDSSSPPFRSGPLSPSGGSP